MSFEGFLRTRVRFQRTGDSRLFSGWILEITQGHVLITASDAGPYAVGEAFFIQANGIRSSTTFKAVLVAASNGNLRFEIKEAIRVMRSTEEARVRLDGAIAELCTGGKSTETEVLDISAHGLGLLSPVPIERGEEVQLTITAECGLVIRATGVVRYCQPGQEPQEHRIGIQLNPMDRVEQARWQQLIEHSAS